MLFVTAVFLIVSVVTAVFLIVSVVTAVFLFVSVMNTLGFSFLLFEISCRRIECCADTK